MKFCFELDSNDDVGVDDTILVGWVVFILLSLFETTLVKRLKCPVKVPTSEGDDVFVAIGVIVVIFYIITIENNCVFENLYFTINIFYYF